MSFGMIAWVIITRSPCTQSQDCILEAHLVRGLLNRVRHAQSPRLPNNANYSARLGYFCCSIARIVCVLPPKNWVTSA